MPGNERRRADGRHRGMKKKRKLPGKFYAALIFAAAALMLVILCNLTGRGDSDTVSVQTESAREEKAPAEADSAGEPEESQKIPAEEAEPDRGEELPGWTAPEEPEGTGAGAGLDLGEYYWGKKRYTEITVGYLTEDMQWRDFVDIRNGETMEETMGTDYGGVAILLESYLDQHNIQADTATVLCDRYQGASYGREEYYIRFNDSQRTLVTFLYYPPQGEHGAYLDVLPCQYTEKEIQRLS